MARLNRSDLSDALAQLDAHYNVLGCAVGSPRLDHLLQRIKPHQTTEAADILGYAFQALATDGPSDFVLRDLARGTWLTFLDPAQPLAELIDEFGVADAYLGRPGAYGRQWARHICDAAWTVWVASGGYSSGSAGIAP